MRPLLVLIIPLLISCNSNDTPSEDPDIRPRPTGIAQPKNIPYSIISQYPHDTSAFTQGLEFYKGKLYEGTGDFEASSIRVTDIKTGKVEKIHMMGTDKIFGEGITILANKLYQLTWQNNTVYVYNVDNIAKPVKTFPWPNEGWGITNNGTDLIISDGTSNIYFVDPATFRVKNTLGISDDAGPVDSLNELEWINGLLYANVYQQDYIIQINPESGHVVGKMIIPSLQTHEKISGRTDVLNGIAYDSSTKKIFVTGKRWPKLFELRLN